MMMSGMKPNKMNISVICVGSNIESENVLKGLLDHNKKIRALITRPPGNKGSVCDYVDLHPLCEKNGIPTIDTLDINAGKTIQQIKKYHPDYLFTLGWSQIFSKNLIGLFNEMVIGSHPTKLPAGRGRAPIPWTILQGKEESAVSFFKIDNGIDSGELLLQLPFKIPKRAFAWDVYKRAADKLSDGFIALYNKLERGEKIEPIHQDENNVSYNAKRVPSDGKIDFMQTADKIDRLVRAVSYPYPGAYFFYKDKRIIVNYSEPEYNSNTNGVVAQILDIKSDQILVQTGGSAIWLGDFNSWDGEKLEAHFFEKHDKLGYDIEEEIYQLKKKNTWL